MSSGISQNKTVEEVLINNIPGACKIIPAHSDNDRNGTDWWIEHTSGKFISVDCKVREKDWSLNGKDDLALEIWSVVENKTVGWTRNSRKRTDFILWLWMDTGRWCLVPFPFLCKIFSDRWAEYKNKYKTAKQFTPNNGGYHSECVFVPRREIWAEIYKIYSGKLNG